MFANQSNHSTCLISNSQISSARTPPENKAGETNALYPYLNGVLAHYDIDKTKLISSIMPFFTIRGQSGFAANI